MKPPKDINYVLVEFNSFLKSQRQMKSCLFIIYLKAILSDNEEIIKYAMFQYRLSQYIEGLLRYINKVSCLINIFLY